MKKGFTLIELIATLVILSIVAIIVVPNIDKNFKKMVKGVTDVQREAIIEASKNWANDNINSMPSVNDGVVYVYLKELKDGGYLSENVYKNTDLTNLKDEYQYLKNALQNKNYTLANISFNDIDVNKVTFDTNLEVTFTLNCNYTINYVSNNETKTYNGKGSTTIKANFNVTDSTYTLDSISNLPISFIIR